jgi:hypothetical protein
VLHSIDLNAQHLCKLAKHPNIGVRQMQRGCPHFGFYRADHKAVMIQSLNYERSGYSPLWEVASDSPLYTAGTKEFEALWACNDPGLKD